MKISMKTMKKQPLKKSRMAMKKPMKSNKEKSRAMKEEPVNDDTEPEFEEILQCDICRKYRFSNDMEVRQYSPGICSKICLKCQN